MKEEWKDIKGYEGFYQISNKGNVRSLDRIVHQRGKFGQDTIHFYPSRQLVPYSAECCRYLYIDLHSGGRFERRFIHRLVAEHFIPKCSGKEYVNHIDCNPMNNDADNLEWCTQSQNIQYAYDLGRKIPPHQKPIGQYTEDMKLVRVWESAAKIGRELDGVSASNILKVCHGVRQHAGGYRWAYIQ